jgi:hypothetical protein
VTRPRARSWAFLACLLPARALAENGRAAENSAESTDDSSASVTVRGRSALRESTATALTAEVAASVPGTEGDPLKAVLALPGVVRPSFGLGPLIVWGAAPRDTRVYVDGVPIPALYHADGVRSTVGSGMVGNLELVPGAALADFGRGLGGVIRVTTRALPESGVHGFAAADLLDASTMVAAAPTSRVRFAVGGRYGYFDRVVGAASDSVLGVVSVPRYDDLQAKVTWRLREREQLSAVFLHSADEGRRGLYSSADGSPAVEATSRSFQRYYLNYVHLPDRRTRVTVTPYYGFDREHATTTSDGIATRLDDDTVRYGVRASRETAVSDALSLVTGIDVEGARSKLLRLGSLTLPAREGDVALFGQPPATDTVNFDRWETHVLGVAPYVMTRLAMGPVTVTPGLRLDGYLTQTNRTLPPIGGTPTVGGLDLRAALEPRLSVEWQTTRALALSAAAGIYHAPPAPEDLSAVFGTPALTLSSARHVALGQSVEVTPSTRIELEEYVELLSHLTARSRLAAPTIAQSLVQDGEGRTYGAQVLVRQEAWHGFSGWITYSLGRSERRYVGDGAYRLFDYDRTHVASVVARQEVADWAFGARVQLASGLPRTPVTGAIYSPADDRYLPVLGAQNTDRLPLFFELDLRIDRRFAVNERVTVDLYGELINATDHGNDEEVVYNYDFTKHAYITGVPRLAFIGGRVDF